MNNKSKITSLIACLSLTVLIFGVVQGGSYLWASLRTTKRFNYTQYLDNEGLTWTGPKRGEIIDLRNFRSKEGQELPANKNNLIALGFVSSKCWMCSESSDLIEYVKTNCLKNGIDYYLVSLGTNETPDEFFSYASKLNLSSNSYIWGENKEDINLSLKSMVVPSHILVDGNGVVLRRFPGGRKEKEIRDQMGNETMDEILEEKTKINQ
jgi:hypothetical protein